MKGVVVPAIDSQLIQCTAQFLCYGPDTHDGRIKCHTIAEDYSGCPDFDESKVLLVSPEHINCNPSHSLYCSRAGRREECRVEDGHEKCGGHLQDEKTPDCLMQKLRDALTWSFRERGLI